MGISLPTPTLKLSGTRMIRFSFVLAFSLTLSVAAMAQTGSVGIGTNTPSDKAILDITSTEKGLLIPRLSEPDRDANLLTPGILAPDYNGMLIFNTTTKSFNVWKDDNWTDIGGAAGIPGMPGSPGAPGTPGATWFSGINNLPADPTNANEPATAKDGDLYLNTSSREVYKRGLGAWTKTADLTLGTPGVGITLADLRPDGTLEFTYSNGTKDNVGMVRGANGADGANGINGTNGTNGIDGADGADGVGISSAVINGAGELILNYSNLTSSNVGMVKGADGAPGAPGANGTNGTDGADGAPGSKWTSGAAAPNNATGIDGDMHYNTTTNTIWQKVGGVWTDTGNSINSSSGWSLSGNASPAAGAFLGTSTADDLIIKTDNTTRAIIKGGNGNIGVGNNDPKAALHVKEINIGPVESLINQVLRNVNVPIATVVPGTGIILNNSSGKLQLTVSGVSTGGTAMVSPTSALPSGIIISYVRVSDTLLNTVEVGIQNISGANYNVPLIGLGALRFNVTVIQ